MGRTYSRRNRGACQFLRSACLILFLATESFRARMHLEGLIDQAARLHQSATIGDLLLYRQNTPSPIEVSVYEPVICLILQGRKQVTIGEQTLSFSPGECLLVTHDLPVTSRITRAPYAALIFKVDVTTIRKLYDEVSESALDDEQARAAETHRADPGMLDALRRYLALAEAPADAKVLGP